MRYTYHVTDGNASKTLTKYFDTRPQADDFNAELVNCNGWHSAVCHEAKDDCAICYKTSQPA